MRLDNRSNAEMRPLSIQRSFTRYAPGSVLIAFGETKVLCTATIEEKVPPFLRDKGTGWLSAEYSLLPSSTHTRSQREVNKGKASGRTNEIQRLIGRSLRAVLDFDLLGERTIHIDADVIQADGGTRTAAITGGMIALYDAVVWMQRNGHLKVSPIKEWLAAISVGVVRGQVVCDLCYEEDSQAEVDMNVVMTESGRFVEIQGTAEQEPFAQDTLQKMLATASGTLSEMITRIKQETR
ncbi:MAG: ribonuclease PH [Candidatus Margulisiibacteriota bacterium]